MKRLNNSIKTDIIRIRRNDYPLLTMLRPRDGQAQT